MKNGDTIPIRWDGIDTAGAGITAGTGKATIQRVSDSNYWDGATWGTAGASITLATIGNFVFGVNSALGTPGVGIYTAILAGSSGAATAGMGYSISFELDARTVAEVYNLGTGGVAISAGQSVGTVGTVQGGTISLVNTASIVAGGTISLVNTASIVAGGTVSLVNTATQVTNAVSVSGTVALSGASEQAVTTAILDHSLTDGTHDTADTVGGVLTMNVANMSVTLTGSTHTSPYTGATTVAKYTLAGTGTTSATRTKT